MLYFKSTVQRIVYQGDKVRDEQNYTKFCIYQEVLL